MKKSERLNIRIRVLPDGEPMTIIGRQAWALRELCKAGERGCTPITHPGPRWSDYVLKNRKAGLLIETINEPHAGDFPGAHARYVLRSEVEIISDGSKPQATGASA